MKSIQKKKKRKLQAKRSENHPKSSSKEGTSSFFSVFSSFDFLFFFSISLDWLVIDGDDIALVAAVSSLQWRLLLHDEDRMYAVAASPGEDDRVDAEVLVAAASMLLHLFPDDDRVYAVLVTPGDDWVDMVS